MKQTKRFRVIVLLCVLLMCFSTVSQAASATGTKKDSGVETFAVGRATNSFNVTIPAGKIMTAETGFSMAAGESVKIHAVYEPESASMDYGVVSSDGLFHPVRASDGYIDASIKINTKGTYTFAIRNNSSVEVQTTGYVNY